MGKLNMDKARQKKEELDNKRGGFDFDFWTPKDGRNVVRVLPPKGDYDDFYEEVPLHFNVGPDSKLVYCIGKKCPVCKELEKLEKSKNKEDQKLFQDMARKNRVYLNIIDRDDPDTDGGEVKIQVASVGPMILGGILDHICDSDYGDVTSFEDGYDMIITKTGKGRKTEYTVKARPKQSVAVEGMEPEDLDEILVDLQEIAVLKTVDEIEAILYGEDDETGKEEVSLEDMDLEQLISYAEEKDIDLSDVSSKDIKKANKVREFITEYLLAQEENEEEKEKEEKKSSTLSSKGSGKTSGKSKGSDEDDLKNEIQSAVNNRRRR